MTDEVTPVAPTADKPVEPKAPVTPPGQAAVGDDVPDKFKGKSAAEIAKSYLELEKEHGKHSKEVKEAREEIEQWKALGQVIGGKPELKKAIQDEIDRLSRKPADDPSKPGEPTKPDDTKIAMQDQIIDKFQEDRGLRLIPKEKKQELDKAMVQELVEMLDVTGKKTPAEVFAMIPTNRLNHYLDKAYKLATSNDKEERTRSQEFIAARENSMATIGSIPSSGVRGDSMDLTPGEKEAARRMNISEEDYKKNKIAYLKGE